MSDALFFQRTASLILKDTSSAGSLTMGVGGGYASSKPSTPSNGVGRRREVLVLCGPVIGKVTENSAVVMLETDIDATVTCTATPEVQGRGRPASCMKRLREAEPGVFQLTNLMPDTRYHISFSPLAEVQQQEMQFRTCTIKTLPLQVEQLRIVALSCDRPARLEEGQENPWDRLAAICKAGACDVMLHLGDQVYTKENNCLKNAMRVMDTCGKPGVSDDLRHRIEREGAARLQEAYRTTWYSSSKAYALAHSSHLMLWSDNDVANDFTTKKKADGSQAYMPCFLRVGMRVYRMYQRQLWDPECVVGQQRLESLPAIEEWHFHRYGPCGVFLIDMRGNRIRPDGIQKDGDILSMRQRRAIEQAFEVSDLKCMLLCAEIPFVGDPPDTIRAKAKKIPFLMDHWPYQISELLWLLDLCFSWKSAVPGREVLMLAGDIHVSVDSTITDNYSGQTIRHIVTSPITNHVCGFYPELEGSLNERYSYTHRPLPDSRTYATVDLNFASGRTVLNANLVGIPTCPNKTYEKTADALVLCGPIIGTVDDTSANVLLEVDSEVTLTCKARPVSTNKREIFADGLVADTRTLKKNTPEVFKLRGLKPNTKYNLSFDPLAAVQTTELQTRGCVVRTMLPPAEIKRFRVVALSCDRPARLMEGQENPWGRVAEIVKRGECDVMLHLGDQVYTKEHDWTTAAMRVMDVCEMEGVTKSLRLKMEDEAFEKLQQAYRATWYPKDISTVLSHSSHLMIWSDNDVANDFTIKKNKDGSQAYTPSYLRVGMRVYRMYQRQLWDPECVTDHEQLEALPETEEWHFHRYGPCGIFLIDMRGNRIRPDGVQKEGTILSGRQQQAIEKAFQQPGIRCMLVCSEIPFVGDPPEVIHEKAKKFIFLKDHWPYQVNELTWLLDLCFSWKAAEAGREVIMLAGDIHVSVESVISDNRTNQTIRQIVTSPITNHVCGFFPDLKGSVNARYSYEHKPLPDVRTFCCIDVDFGGADVNAKVDVVCVPAKAPEH
eukprot:TRINITY_DN2177_c0_g1_i1.p1 TRINITY_DN2177_c0_g1~~TRINITY_DN2177_c0_g1_i1.p1  ORF type:complete len:1025 (-),score=185.00 TRINITY_DN2177_c0_g1_i1:24-3032(-)